jgi:hypothetical protein
VCVARVCVKYVESRVACLYFGKFGSSRFYASRDIQQVRAPERRER